MIVSNERTNILEGQVKCLREEIKISALQKAEEAFKQSITFAKSDEDIDIEINWLGIKYSSDAYSKLEDRALKELPLKDGDLTCIVLFLNTRGMGSFFENFKLEIKNHLSQFKTNKDTIPINSFAMKC